jgi:hypothetical protein
MASTAGKLISYRDIDCLLTIVMLFVTTWFTDIYICHYFRLITRRESHDQRGIYMLSPIANLEKTH